MEMKFQNSYNIIALQPMVVFFIAIILFCSNYIYYDVKIPCKDIMIHENNQRICSCLISDISEKGINEISLKESFLIIENDTISGKLLLYENRLTSFIVVFQSKKGLKLKRFNDNKGFIVYKRSFLKYIFDCIVYNHEKYINVPVR